MSVLATKAHAHASRATLLRAALLRVGPPILAVHSRLAAPHRGASSRAAHRQVAWPAALALRPVSARPAAAPLRDAGRPPAAARLVVALIGALLRLAAGRSSIALRHAVASR